MHQLKHVIPLLAVSLTAAVVMGDDGTANCQATLQDQAKAWNKGDIEGFLKGYRQSPHTVFSGKSNTAVGFSRMAARYRKRYPNRKAMGELTFSDVSFKALSADEILAMGRWKLRKKVPTGGRFVLIMRLEGGTCRVAMDYTTVDPQ